MQNTQPKIKPPDPRCGPRPARALSRSRTPELPNTRIPDPPNHPLFPQSRSPKSPALSPIPISPCHLPPKEIPAKRVEEVVTVLGGAERRSLGRTIPRGGGGASVGKSRVVSRGDGAEPTPGAGTTGRPSDAPPPRKTSPFNVARPPADASSRKQKRAPREPRSARISDV